jgi:hypothetical protein
MAAQRPAESGQMPGPAPLYRYRTAALVGPWRETRAQATADALQAGQVRRDECQPHELRWMVEGRIEERNADRPAAGRARRVAPPRGV